MCGGFWERRRLDNWGSGKVVVEDSLSVGFEDGFGGHCEGFMGSLLDSSYFKGFGIGSESTQLMGGYGEKFEVMLDLTRIGIV